MSVLAVIPARGGSKGIHRKNLRLLAGKPLISYTVEAARRATSLTRVICSTEDIEIAEVVRSLGVEVPFLRPNQLATDTASQLDVVQHATQMMEELDNTVYEKVVLLQPTSPLRTAEDIDAALALFDKEDLDSVFSLSRVGQGHPYYMYIFENGQPVPLLKLPKQITRRQEFPPVYVRNGAIYAVQRSVLMKRNSLYGDKVGTYVMPASRSINIDAEQDLEYAEFLLANSANNL